MSASGWWHSQPDEGQRRGILREEEPAVSSELAEQSPLPHELPSPGGRSHVMFGTYLYQKRVVYLKFKGDLAALLSIRAGLPRAGTVSSS